MNPERARELLGGLASGILTPEEQQVLFEAALHDQALFNEVADELEFAAFLQSPETRAQLANRIEVEPERPRWWVLRPRWLALSAALAGCAVLFVVLRHRPGDVPPQAVAETVVVTVPAQPPTTGVPKPEPPRTANRVVKRKVAPEPVEIAKSEPKAKTEATADAAKPRDQIAVASPVAPLPAPRFAPQSLGVGGAAPPSGSPRANTPMRAAAVPPAAPEAAPPPPVPPQAPATASLEGTVHDPSGSPLRNAAIRIVNNATQATTVTSSDAAGKFAVPSLPAGGPYTVVAQAPGFKREERSGIILAVNQPAQIDIPLQVGAVANTVEVLAAASLVKANVQDKAQARRSQVAVLDFVNGTAQSQSGQQAADLLSSQLLDSGQVGVINREKVRQNQAAPGRPPSAKEAADMGRRMGADAVIMGSVQPGGASRSKDQAGSDVALTAQVIETKKAQSLAQVAANGPSLQGAANLLGLKLQSQLAQLITGAVTRVDSGFVTVAIPAPAEPRIGERFDVYRGTRKIGELTVTSAYGQTAVGTFSGNGPPRKGDHVTSLR